MSYDIGPDIEVAADEFVDQQEVRRQMAMEDAREEVLAGIQADEFAGVNSCDALRSLPSRARGEYDSFRFDTFQRSEQPNPPSPETEEFRLPAVLEHQDIR